MATGRWVGKEEEEQEEEEEEEGGGGVGGRRDGSTTRLSRDTGTGFTCQTGNDIT